MRLGTRRRTTMPKNYVESWDRWLHHQAEWIRVKNELKGGEVYNGAHITEIQNCPRHDKKLSKLPH